MIKFNRLLILLAFFGLNACLNDDFDAPPIDGETEITQDPTISIAGLKELASEDQIVQLKTDLKIKGQIVADDQSGNFFREFILQDESAGISVLINLTSAYTLFPIGREILINCQGLYLGVENGVPKLGGYVIIEGGGESLGNIVDFQQRIIRGKLKTPLEAAVRSIDQLGPGDIGRLIKLENVEFGGNELSLTFSDPIGRSSVNRTIVDCNGREIILRSSGFADFAGEVLPPGNGSLVAIYSVFRDDQQLFIRNLEDVQFLTDRCSGGGTVAGNETVISIEDVRDLFAGGTTTAPNERKIEGIVISDKDNGNFDNRNLILQDESGGIIVRFENDHNFALNEKVEVVVSGQELSEFRGLLQVNGVPNNFAKGLGAGESPSPRVATIAEILDNSEAWESTLIKINQVSLPGNTSYEGGITLTDATGSIDLFTRSSASFASTAVPEGAVNMTLIVSQFNDPQVILRNLNDIEGDTSTNNSGGNEELISLMEVRDLFITGNNRAPGDRLVKGIVISDMDNQNLNIQNVVIQDGTGGVVVRFQDAHNLKLGEEVEIIISNQELSEFNSLLQVNNVPNANVTVLGMGDLPEPRVASIQEIIDNLEAWESTLVQIKEASITGGTTYQGATTVSDATGSIAMFTRNEASFANMTLPTSSVTITAIVSQFDDPQLVLRNIQDVE